MKYPDWICLSCGDNYATKPNNSRFATWYQGICGWCKKEAPVTEPRDFGHPFFSKEKGHGKPFDDEKCFVCSGYHAVGIACPSLKVT